MKSIADGRASEWYNEKAHYGNADRVTVSGGNDTPNINFTLGPDGTISGHVYESDGVTPIENAEVWAAADDDHYVYSARTDSTGAYTIHGMSADNYRVKARTENHATEWWQEKNNHFDGDWVAVSVNSDVNAIDFTLDAAGAISGHVFKSDGATVIDDAQISIHAHGVSEGSSSLGTYASQSDGSYTISGLAPGSYKVQVNNNRHPAYQTKYYDDMGAFENAYIIQVVAEETTQGIDFQLEPNSSIDVGTAGGTLEHIYADGATTTVQVPADAMTETMSLVYEPKGEYPSPEDGRPTGPSFQLTVQDVDGPVEGFVFQKPITVEIEYTDEDVALSNEDEILLYLYVYDTNSWVDAATTCDPPSEYTRMPNRNTIAVDICHLSYFGTFGPDEAEYTRLPALSAE